jgi:hypothetical protein
MWQTNYDSSPYVNFKFSYSIIGKFDISHSSYTIQKIYPFIPIVSPTSPPKFIPWVEIYG